MKEQKQIMLENVNQAVILLNNMLSYLESMRGKKKHINKHRLSNTADSLQNLLNNSMSPDVVHEINNQLCILFLYSNNIGQNSKYDKYYEQLNKLYVWVKLLDATIKHDNNLFDSLQDFIKIYHIDIKIPNDYPHLAIIAYGLLEYNNNIHDLKCDTNCLIFYGNLYQPRLNSLIQSILYNYIIDLSFERQNLTKTTSTTLYINFQSKI